MSEAAEALGVPIVRGRGPSEASSPLRSEPRRGREPSSQETQVFQASSQTSRLRFRFFMFLS